MPVLSQELHYFRVMARTGSLGRAADALGVTQPALSKALRRLESRVGVSLMSRTARGVLLTDAGQTFLDLTTQAASVMDDAVQAARDLGSGHAGHVHLGVTPGTFNFLVDALFPRLQADRPAAVIQLTTAFNDALFEALLARQMSLAVCPLPESLPHGLTQEWLFDDGFFLVHNREHPLAQGVPFDPRQLHTWRAATSGPHEVARQNFERLIRQQGLRPPQVVVEANTLQALVRVVERAPLITIIPRRAFRPADLPDNLVLTPLNIPGLNRAIGLVHGPGHRSAMAVRAAELLREAAEAL